MARHTLRPLRQADAVPSCTSGVFFREWNDLVDNPRFPKEFSWNSWERHLHQWAGQPINLRNHQTEEFWESACIEVGRCVFLKIPTKSSKQCVHYVFLSQLKHWNSWYLFPPISTHFSTNHETKTSVSNNKLAKKKQPSFQSGCPHPLFATSTFVCTAHQLEALHLYGCDSSRKTWTPGSQLKSAFRFQPSFIILTYSSWNRFGGHAARTRWCRNYTERKYCLVCDSWKSRI